MKNTPVLMPKLGQAMTAGTVQQWHHKAGERVQQGDVLVTIETDKATYDIEAPASGILHIHVQEGQEVPIGTVIGDIGETTTQVVTSAVSPTPRAPTAAREQPPTRKKILASPKAKQLAAERGIDLATVTPSSADGVISAADVEKAMANRASRSSEAQPTMMTTVVSVTDASRKIRERRLLTGIRKTAARRVQEAWQTIPHIVQMVDVEATQLLALRAQLRAEIPSLTLNDLILHAAAQVIADLPDLNATVEGDALVLYDDVHVGFATDTPRGLIVPVIRGADKLSMKDLAVESQRLIEAARAGRLRPDDMGHASLTVSNLGMFGIRFGTPVINLGEPLLVFVGAVEERPVADHGQVVIRPLMTLSIAYDHRVTDGVGAARFTQGLKKRLESSVLSPESKAQSPNPQSQELGKRELRSTSDGSGYAVHVQSRGHAWVLDEPTAEGGTDNGPDPVAAFLGALLSCMTISFKAAAQRRKVTIERVQGHVQATPQGHVKNIAMTLEVWSPDPEENVRALLEVAKRGCYVSGVLKPEIDFKVELVIRAS